MPSIGGPPVFGRSSGLASDLVDCPKARTGTQSVIASKLPYFFIWIISFLRVPSWNISILLVMSDPTRTPDCFQVYHIYGDPDSPHVPLVRLGGRPYGRMTP